MPTRLKKTASILLTAVREIGVSVYHGTKLRASLKSLEYRSTKVLMGVRVGLNLYARDNFMQSYASRNMHV